MRKEFPLIPASVVDSCLNSLTEGFSIVAPSQLKKALKPGGLEKVKPQLEAVIVRNLQQQPMVAKITLPLSEKKKLLRYLVGLALDYMLEDVGELLKAPQERLLMLERQEREIKRYMNRRQLLWYQMRHHPNRTFAFTALSACYA